MDGRVTMLGDPALLQFEFLWESEEASGTAAEATRGTLIVRLLGRAMWGATPDEPHGFSWTWVELAEHLTRHWAYLFVEESDPLGLGVPPERLRAKAEERWGAVTEALRGEEEEELWAYLESHDLASAVHGAYPASLWVTREGCALRVACKDVVVEVPVKRGRDTLVALGDAIVSRLRAVSGDARATTAVQGWERREDIAPMRLAEIATGLPAAEVTALAEVIELPFARLRFEDAFESDEYLAVARMARGALPIEELQLLFGIIRAQPAVWTVPIDKLADGAAEILGAMPNKPAFEQGYAVAVWLREALSLRDDRVEPKELLERWKIPLIDERLSSRDVDAISIWGPKHGPAVIVNRNGLHGRMNGRRATLAHEIGHLVMDRRVALPLAEVMGGRISNRVEMRARAFAASFLVPSTVAWKAVTSARSTKELGRTLSDLSGFYGASLEILAWQAYNASGRRLPPMIYTYLKSQGLLDRPV